MAVGATGKTLRDGAMTWTDASGTPITFTPVLDMGDLTFTLNYKERLVIKARAVRKGLRYGDDPDTDANLAWSEVFWGFTDATDGTTLDMSQVAGKFSGATTTATSGGGYDADFTLYDGTYTVEGTDHGDAADHTATFSDVLVMQAGFTEGKPSTQNFVGECYGGVAFTGES